MSEHDLAAIPPDDPDLAFIFADMATWEEVFPCTCSEDVGLHDEGCPQA